MRSFGAGTTETRIILANQHECKSFLKAVFNQNQLQITDTGYALGMRQDEGTRPSFLFCCATDPVKLLRFGELRSAHDWQY
jgi:hypothetical protein